MSSCKLCSLDLGSTTKVTVQLFCAWCPHWHARGQTFTLRHFMPRYISIEVNPKLYRIEVDDFGVKWRMVGLRLPRSFLSWCPRPQLVAYDVADMGIFIPSSNTIGPTTHTITSPPNHRIPYCMLCYIMLCGRHLYLYRAPAYEERQTYGYAERCTLRTCVHVCIRTTWITIVLLRKLDDENSAIYRDAAHRQIISTPIGRFDAILLWPMHQ